jgi:hypothetical protein
MSLRMTVNRDRASGLWEDVVIVAGEDIREGDQLRIRITSTSHDALRVDCEGHRSIQIFRRAQGNLHSRKP